MLRSGDRCVVVRWGGGCGTRPVKPSSCGLSVSAFGCGPVHVDGFLLPLGWAGHTREGLPGSCSRIHLPLPKGWTSTKVPSLPPTRVPSLQGGQDGAEGKEGFDVTHVVNSEENLPLERLLHDEIIVIIHNVHALLLYQREVQTQPTKRCAEKQ